MDSYDIGPSPDGYGVLSRPMPSHNGTKPSGRVVLDSYQNDIIQSFEPQAPATFNQNNPDHPQSSSLVDLKDPIQVHLLTETALGDSKQYEILSQEELDDLKKECQALTQRIDNTKSNLLIQAKYRDAAASMARLYPSTATDSKRRSWLDGNQISGDDMREAAVEREACERKCEELASELFNLEKQLMDPKLRILHHTAGVLQLAYQASLRRLAQQSGQPPNGMPGSPESMFTYSMGRDSLDAPGDEMFMEDGYFALDTVDARVRRNLPPLEIPLRSPGRERQSQLRDEMDRLKEENNSLVNSVTEMGRKLHDINSSLRDTILKFDPVGNSDYAPPPGALANEGVKQEDVLRSQVEYLASGLVAVRAEQELHKASTGGGGSDNGQIGERIASMNLQLRDLLMIADAHYEPVAMPDEENIEDQLNLLENSLSKVDTIMSRLLQGGAGSSGLEATMTEMWDTIQNGYATIKKMKEDRRRTRAEKGLEDDDSMSDDDGIDLADTYSPLNLSSRVRWLYRQATTLKEQKSVLKRQIKQQRELNSKSDAEKDAELAQKQEMLDENQLVVERLENDATDTQRKLSEALADLERVRAHAIKDGKLETELQDRAAGSEALETKLREMQATLHATESESEQAQRKLAQVDSKISSLSAQLEKADKSRVEAESRAGNLERDMQQRQEALEETQKALKEKEKDMDELNASFVELKMEATIAKAELDGAYGSRAERAADAAALRNIHEVEKLQAQVIKLKEELSGTVKELEDITKETIATERERVDLEGKLDDAVHARTLLEAELTTCRERFESEIQRTGERMAKLQEDLDNERLKAGRGDGVRAGAGASVISAQFRTAMREERKKHQEEIRGERSRTRKIEEELAKLKRAQGPGKSPLNPQ